MSRKGGKSKSSGNHSNAVTPEQNLSAILTNIVGMVTHIAERQEQLEGSIIAALKKITESQESQPGSSFVPLMCTTAAATENQDEQSRFLIEMPTTSMSDLRINHVHTFLETHAKNVDSSPDGVKNLINRLEKRIRWECQERADELCNKENGKLPSWRKLSKKKQLVWNITEEAESLGIPARQCEDLWPVVFLVRQHWSNKTRYRRQKRNKLKKRLLERKHQARDNASVISNPEDFSENILQQNINTDNAATKKKKGSKSRRFTNHPKELIIKGVRQRRKSSVDDPSTVTH